METSPKLKQLFILRYPNPILNAVSEDCTEADLLLINENYDEMVRLTNATNGVGLAAVQVGILKRFCIVRDSGNEYNLIINPELVEGLDLTPKKEGCLSLPFFSELVERFEQVTIKFRDSSWTERTAVMTGIEAQCIQHEMNHMSGLLILDTVSLMKQQMYNKKLRKKYGN